MDVSLLEFQEKIMFLLRNKSKSVAVAESCTSGLVAAALTHLSGSSEYFRGGVVAYHNDVKTKILNVSSDTLAKEGAVSQSVAESMASGVAKLLGADYGMSTTGIAGPGGGTPAKPVGTVWISVSSKTHTVSERLLLKGDRESIRQQSVNELMRLFCRHLES